MLMRLLCFHISPLNHVTFMLRSPFIICIHPPVISLRVSPSIAPFYPLRIPILINLFIKAVCEGGNDFPSTLTQGKL